MMKINYRQILNKNMVNVLKDVLINIEENGIQQGHNLYITFKTNDPKNKIPNWLKEKYPEEMTIVLQYEYWNFKVNKNFFTISLSFDDIKTNLEIYFESVISFADPYAKFGLQLIEDLNVKIKTKEIKPKKNQKENSKKNNIIDFSNFKKN